MGDQTLQTSAAVHDHQIAARFRIKSSGRANSAAIVTAGTIRLTVLTSRCLRIEYSSQALFDNRPSIVILNRALPVPEFSVRDHDNIVDIETDHLVLHCKKPARELTADSLQITIKQSGTTWRFGEKDQSNLGGTCRTLDSLNGPCEIENGLLSRSGWAILDDSQSPLFTESGWVEQRADINSQDIYFFGYETDYKSALRDYFIMSGPVPVVPRWALGIWWSKHTQYNSESVLDFIRTWKAHRLPLSVFVFDMWWHTTKNPYHDGWTGYTWKPDHYPDPAKMLSKCHEMGIRVTLNVHPRDGVFPHETQYRDLADHVGVNPESGNGIAFEPVDPAFMDGYFKHLHHVLEDQGVDFWWIDWQQGDKTKLSGLDPLFWLNHLHTLDMNRCENRRPLILSRWGGMGSHRYPAQFSGDTYVTWESLAFQPYFTATAGNVGSCYWSHDIGGYMGGIEDPELYVRWIQFGALSPIFRLHACSHPFQLRQPWAYGDEVLRLIRNAFNLRIELIPYLYSSAYTTYDSGVPFMRPMYIDYPNQEQAYAFPTQYQLGDSLIVAPHTKPLDPETRLSRQVVWLPAGRWYNYFTGECYQGDRVQAVYGTLEEVPVFVRGGKIIPIAESPASDSTAIPKHMGLLIYTGENGEFSLVEDDGSTTEYQRQGTSITKICQTHSADACVLLIEAPVGIATHLPEFRAWTFYFFGINASVKCKCQVNDVVTDYAMAYDASRECLSVRLGPTPIRSRISIAISTKGNVSLAEHRDRHFEICMQYLSAFRALTNNKVAIYKWMKKNPIENPADLFNIAGMLSPNQIRAFCELFFDAGCTEIGVTMQNTLLLWNNKEDTSVKYTLRSGKSSNAESGTVPRFRSTSILKKALEDGTRSQVKNAWSSSLHYANILVEKFGNQR